MELLLEKTEDGSHTLFVPKLNEHYHSVNGAVQESRHVFIEAGLHACEKQEVRVFEVGFGTGLNALLTYFDAEKQSKKISYTSIEMYPILMQVINCLNYPAIFSDEHKSAFRELHLCRWNQMVKVSDSFSLNKIKGDLTNYSFAEADAFDVVFFDAFAPEKQPEMWTQEIFDKIYKALAADGILVTYCAKGVVRRMLEKSGFMVERLPGPPGKREMLRARKK